MAVSIGSLKYKVSADISDYSKKMSQLKALRNSATAEEKKRLDIEIKALKNAQKQEQNILRQRAQAYARFINDIRSSMTWFSVGFGAVIGVALNELRNMEQEMQNLKTISHSLGNVLSSNDFSAFGDLADRINEITGATQQSTLDVIAMGMKYGVAKDQLDEYAQAIQTFAKTSGRSASQLQRQINEALESGNYDSLTKIGIYIDENMTKQEAFNELIRQGGIEFQSMDRETSGTLSRNINQLSNNWGNAMEVIGNTINSSLITPFAQWVHENQTVIQNFIQSNFGSIETIFRSIATAGTAMFLTLTESGRNFTKSVADGFINLNKQVLNFGKEFKQAWNISNAVQEAYSHQLNINALQQRQIEIAKEYYTVSAEQQTLLNNENNIINNSIQRLKDKQKVIFSANNLTKENVSQAEQLLKKYTTLNGITSQFNVKMRLIGSAIKGCVVSAGVWLGTTIAIGVAMSVISMGIGVIVGALVEIVKWVWDWWSTSDKITDELDDQNGLLEERENLLREQRQEQLQNNKEIADQNAKVKETNDKLEKQKEILTELQLKREELLDSDKATDDEITEINKQIADQKTEIDNIVKSRDDEIIKLEKLYNKNSEIKDYSKSRAILEERNKDCIKDQTIESKKHTDELKKQKELQEQIYNLHSSYHQLQLQINEKVKSNLKERETLHETEEEALIRQHNEYNNVQELIIHLNSRLKECNALLEGGSLSVEDAKKKTEERNNLAKQLLDTVTKEHALYKSIDALETRIVDTAFKEIEANKQNIGQTQKAEADALKELENKRQDLNLQLRIADAIANGNTALKENLEYAKQVRDVQAQYKLTTEQAIDAVERLKRANETKDEGDKSPTGRKLSKGEQRKREKAKQMLENDDKVAKMSDKERRKAGLRGRLSKSAREKYEKYAKGIFNNKDELSKPTAKHIDKLLPQTVASASLEGGVTPTQTPDINSNQPATPQTKGSDASSGITSILTEIKTMLSTFTSDFKSAFA